MPILLRTRFPGYLCLFWLEAYEIKKNLTNSINVECPVVKEKVSQKGRVPVSFLLPCLANTLQSTDISIFIYNIISHFFQKLFVIRDE